MNDSAAILLYALARTTILLSISAPIVAVLLRGLRCRSPNVHRAAWCAVLLTGWLFIRFPITIPWYETQPNRAALPPPLTSDFGEVAEGVGPAVVPPVSNPGADESMPAVNFTGRAGSNVSWPLVLAWGWLLGMAVIVIAWLTSYARFVLRIRHGLPPRDDWDAEWRAMLAESRLLARVRLRVLPGIGPAVCRAPGGYRLLVPEDLWGELSSQERKAILRHELMHVQRHDLEWLLVARCLAIPHWFNPVSWWVVRNFEEAGEWACDDAVYGRNTAEAVAYARLLLRLGQADERPRWSAAMGGRRLATRIKRTLIGELREDSIVKKRFVLCSLALLLLLGAVEWRLGASAARAIDQEVESSRGGLKVDRRMLQRMADAAAKTFEATKASYDVGTEVMSNVYVWSRRWLEADRALARSDADEIAALEAHRRRMRQLMMKIRAMYVTGTKGGEIERFAATKFYLAEADAWLASAQNRGLDEPAPLKAVSFEFRGPAGLTVQWDEDNDGRFDTEPVGCPADHKFLEGGLYFLGFGGIGGQKLKATLDVPASSDTEVRLELPIADIKRIASGRRLSRAYVLTDGSKVEELSNWDEVPDWNNLRGGLVAEAEQQGKLLAVIHVLP